MSEEIVPALAQSTPKLMGEHLPGAGYGVVRVEADAIYGGTVARFHMSARRPFRAKVSGEILRLLHGQIEPAGEWIASVGSPQNQEIEAELRGLFHETRVRGTADEGPWCRYGMRFYPFISSSLCLRVVCDEPLVRNLMVHLPNTFARIWYASKVSADSHMVPVSDKSVGKDRSLYLYRSHAEAATFQADIRVRLGGPELAAIVVYPLIYWILALITLAILAREPNPTLVLGALGALFAFMLKEWREARAPQQNTLLTAAYVLAGLGAAAWAGLWRAMHLLGIGWAPLEVTSVLILLIIYLILRDVRRFEFTGLLPKHVEWVWSRLIRQADWEQRQACGSEDA
jgi:hypothetical protein